MKKPIIVAVTGAAGHIAYSLLPRIASGELFGNDQPIILNLIEIEAGMRALEGVVMELNDSAFILLKKIQMTSDINFGFSGVHFAFLVGSVPRKSGMERKDLLGINGKIFVLQGQALEKSASSEVKILVVGNPCNTNCLIAMKNAPSIPSDRWFAMTRLDENRAKSALAEKVGVHVSQITKMGIWGNHSSTLYPDFENAEISGHPVCSVITDQDWLKNDFIIKNQQRGATIIAARGLSSAQSAAHAILETCSFIRTVTQNNNWHSIALLSDGSYQIEKDIIFSFPARSDGNSVSVVQNISLSPFAQDRISKTMHELKEEKEMIRDLLPK